VALPSLAAAGIWASASSRLAAVAAAKTGEMDFMV